MSDFELLSLVLMILAIIVTILIEYINNHKKSNRQILSKEYGYSFLTCNL